MENVSNIYGLKQQDYEQQKKDINKTGWFKWLTGGKTEKKAASASAELDRLFSQKQADIARQFSAEEALKARKYSSAEAQKNREYQERLSNTAYQRSISDMRKAGLNPALAYAKLSGATTPGGSMGQSSSAQTVSAKGTARHESQSTTEAITKLVSSVLALTKIGGK